MGYEYAAGLLVAGDYNVVNANNKQDYRDGGGWYYPYVQKRIDESRDLPSSGAAASMTRPPRLVLQFCRTRSRGDTNRHFAHGGTVCEGMNVLFQDGGVRWYPVGGTWWDRYAGTANMWNGDVWIDGEGFVRGFRE